MSEKDNLIRHPGQAGRFYPSAGEELSALIEKLHRKVRQDVSRKAVSGSVAAGIVPHAGIVYCGLQTVHFFDALTSSSASFDTVVILHPNHYGTGPPVSADNHQFWNVPNGNIATDQEFIRELGIPVSLTVQRKEHAAEVVVPYIIHFFDPSIRLVSINILDQRHRPAKEIAVRLSKTARRLGRRLLVIASSDFSHFETSHEARLHDDMVLDRITSRDAEGVYRVVRGNNLSICGFGPIMALMEYSSSVNPDYRIRILSRGDSGNLGNTDEVVSYLSAVFVTEVTPE